MSSKSTSMAAATVPSVTGRGQSPISTKKRAHRLTARLQQLAICQSGSFAAMGRPLPTNLLIMLMIDLFIGSGIRNRDIVRCGSALKPPVSVFANEGVIVPACLRNGRFLVRSGGDKGPARPCCGGVAMHLDLEIGQDMEGIAAIRPGDVLFHESLDSRGSLHGTEAAHPFAILGKQAGIGRKIA